MSKLQIPTEVAQQLHAAGFARKGAWFFREESGLAQCVCFERPGAIVYPTYCIIPLYMPCETRYFTYGRRISEISQYPDGERIDAARLSNALRDEIFPFFESVRTPALLLRRLQTAQAVPRFFFCPPVRLAQLKMYTALLLADRALFRKAADETERLLRDTQGFTSAVKDRIFAEIDTLREKAEEDDAYLRDYFAKVAAISRRACAFNSK